MDDKTEDAWPTPDPLERGTLLAPPPPPPFEPAVPPPDRRVGAGMVLALVAIVLVALGVLIAWLLTHRGHDKPTVTTVVVSTAGTATTNATTATAPKKANVSMPDVRGRSVAAARAALQAAGLKTTVTRATSPKPAGTVVDEAPKPGAKIAKGSTVTLSVARAPATATTTAAQTTQTTTTTTTATTAPTTTAAAPPPPQNATMPDVSNQTEQSAVQAMGKAGILASLVFVPAQDELGTVEQQAKPAGTTVPFHGHVQLNISRGPNDNPLETVPSVIGKTLNDAVSTVQAAHLRLIFLRFPVTSRAQAGKIVQQSPLGGGKAPQNAQVLVFLGAFATR